MSLPKIKPLDAKRLLDQGAILVDIREPHEHAREKVPGAHHLALSKLDEADLALHEGKPVIFHCKSGARTMSNASRLAQKVSGACEAFIVEGGLDAWKKAGLPVAADRHQPIELQRQVQIGAGSLAIPGDDAGPLRFAVVFCRAGIRRCGTDRGGCDGILRHGHHSYAGALEQSDIRRAGPNQNRLRSRLQAGLEQPRWFCR